MSQPEWTERYANRAEDDRRASKQAAREALAVTIGNDGWRLLSVVYQVDAPSWLHEVPALDILRRMWIQNFQWDAGQL